MSFLFAAGELVSVLNSANAADAQRRYASAVDDAAKEGLPPAWQRSLDTLMGQNEAAQAEFDKTIAQQQQAVKVALLGGAALIVVFLVLH
ncbi:MAG TPA: hypothetical protein VIO16_05460 [Dehalococcoidia bacterium]